MRMKWWIVPLLVGILAGCEFFVPSGHGFTVPTYDELMSQEGGD